ncbi:hypothetical protein BGZ72_008936, partial [Mortierella alpina]
MFKLTTYSDADINTNLSSQNLANPSSMDNNNLPSTLGADGADAAPAFNPDMDQGTADTSVD